MSPHDVPLSELSNKLLLRAAHHATDGRGATPRVQNTRKSATFVFGTQHGSSTGRRHCGATSRPGGASGPYREPTSRTHEPCRRVAIIAWRRCRESASGPEPGSWSRSVTAAPSRPPATSPPTPVSPGRPEVPGMRPDSEVYLGGEARDGVAVPCRAASPGEGIACLGPGGDAAAGGRRPGGAVPSLTGSRPAVGAGLSWMRGAAYRAAGGCAVVCRPGPRVCGVHRLWSMQVPGTAGCVVALPGGGELRVQAQQRHRKLLRPGVVGWVPSRWLGRK